MPQDAVSLLDVRVKCVNRITGFAPVAESDSRVLILGSMPGVASIDQQQYYAFRHNVFWRIMFELTGQSDSGQYNKRLNMLKKNKIALWDVIGECQREGSLDSNIVTESVRANNFESFFAKHPDIKAVFFNGARAHTEFRRHVFKTGQARLPELVYKTLPSTSPANARYSYDQKLNHWQHIKQWI